MSDPLEPRTPPRGPSGGGWPEERTSDPEAPKMSAAERIWKVVISPTEVFRAIAARPTWGLVLVVSLIVSLGVLFPQLQKVDFVEGMRQQLAAQGKEMPSGAEKYAEISKYAYPGIATVFLLVLPLIVGAYFLVLNLLGGRLRFAASYSVVLHSYVPYLLQGLLTLPVVLSRQSLNLEEIQSGLLKSSLAAFAPEDAGPRLLVLLSSFDLFTIWCLALMILGFSVAARVSKATAATFVLGGWGAWTLTKLLLAGFSPS